MTTYPAGTDIKDMNYFDRGTKVIFHCALHPDAVFMSKDPFASQWFPANKVTSEAEFSGRINELCPCTLKNGIWLTSFEYKNTEGTETDSFLRGSK